MGRFNSDRHFFNCPPDCPKRKPGCQDHCRTYLDKRAELDALKAAERKRKEIDTYTIEQVTKHKNRAAIRNRDVPKKKVHP